MNGSSYCTFEGFTIHYFELASVTWVVNLSVIIYFMLQMNQAPTLFKYFDLCQIAAIVAPAVMLMWPAAGLGGSIVQGPLWCQIDPNTSGSVFFYYGYILLGHFIIFLVFVLAKHSLMNVSSQVAIAAKGRLKKAASQARSFKVSNNIA